MPRKALLILLVVAALAAFVPVSSPAITLGRICVQTLSSGADRGCEFDAGGRSVGVLGVVTNPGLTQLDVWVTTTDDPAAEPVVLCSAVGLPLASACRKNVRNLDLTGTLYCWANSNGAGVFACFS